VPFNLERSGPWIGTGGIFALLFVAFPAFKFAPLWGLALILGLLGVQAMIIARWARTHPAWCAWVPLGGLVAYVFLVLIGAHWWGWGF
jgi:hypothetical protein